MKQSSSSWFLVYLLVFENVTKFGTFYHVVLSQKLTPPITSFELIPLELSSGRAFNNILDDDKYTASLCEKILYYERIYKNKFRVPTPNQLNRDVLGCKRRKSHGGAVQHDQNTLNWDFCLFDCKALDTYLDSKFGIKWLLPKFLNAFFRGIAQVVIVNNPISGLLILIGIFCSNLEVGLITSITAAVAIFTAWCIGQDDFTIQQGLTTYNAALLGSATSSIWIALYSQPLTPRFYGIMIVGAVLSVFVNSGVGNIVEHWDLPTLTLPFNIVAILIFTIFRPPPPTPLSKKSLTISERTELDFLKIKNKTKYQDLDWWKVGEGIIYSIGQVYGVQTLPGSILMFTGALLYSPIVFAMCFMGATVGTLTGLLFTTTPPYTTVYTGIWGYNGVLAAVAVGGFFFALNEYSLLSAVLDVIFAVFIQQALTLAFSPLTLPALTFPFVLSTFMFLSVTSHEDYLTRVVKFSFPEKHIRDYYHRLKEKQMNTTAQTHPEDATLETNN